jgi:hypothetical protein
MALDDPELQLKRIDSAIKIFDAAIDRQFKLASFALAGNVGAIAASALAVKDYREKDKPLGSNFSDAMFWFFLGAVVATVSLGIVLITSEAASYLVISIIAKGPTKNATQMEFFNKISNTATNSKGLLFFVILYAFSAWCFFYGLYKMLSLVR